MAAEPRNIPLADRAPTRWGRETLSTALTWAMCAYLLAMPLGAWLMWRYSQPGSEVNFHRARFAAVNALTGTGFQTAIGVNNYNTFGQIVVLILMLLGAMFTMTAGGLFAARVLRLRHSDGEIVLGGIIAPLVLMNLAAAPFIGTHGPLGAFFMGASAVSNCGLFIGAPPSPWTWETHLVLLPVGFLGSLGLPVLLELWDLIRWQRKLSDYSRLVLALSGALYLAALVLLTVMQWPESGAPAKGELNNATLLSLNCRTLGFPLVPWSQIGVVMQWVLMLLMVIGGGAASSAGGVKLGTVLALARGIRDAYQGRAPGRSFALAAMLLGGYLTLILLLLWSQLGDAPDSLAHRWLFETVSAVSNTGLSMYDLSSAGTALDKMSIGMILGKLGPLGFLWWQSRDPEAGALPVG